MATYSGMLALAKTALEGLVTGKVKASNVYGIEYTMINAKELRDMIDWLTPRAAAEAGDPAARTFRLADRRADT